MKYSSSILLFVICVLLMGCGAFKSQPLGKLNCIINCGLTTPPPTQPDNSENQIPPVIPPPSPSPSPNPEPPVEDQSGSLGTNPIFPSGPIVQLDSNNDTVHVSIPLGPFNPWTGTSVQDAFAGLPGVQVEVVTNQYGSSWLDVSIPQSLLIGGISAAPGRLPSGDSLPGVPNGELPRVETTLPGSHKLFFYLGLNRIAFFLPLSISTPFTIRFPIWNSDRTRLLGEIWLLPPRNGHSGGIYLVFFIPDDWLNIH